MLLWGLRIILVVLWDCSLVNFIPKSFLDNILRLHFSDYLFLRVVGYYSMPNLLSVLELDSSKSQLLSGS